MGKNIVICCDGTSNDVTNDSTNVLRLYRSLERNDDQLTYYDAGVGTVSDPTRLTWWGKQLSRKLDMGIGHSVRENVCKAYRFLCEHYDPGDQIYLFGFSRGAYTVRALAGMIHFLGVARRELAGLDRLAWAIYADDDQSLPVSKRFASGSRFRHAFGIATPVRIHFVGVWDTVSAYGFIWNLRTVPYTANNPTIDHIRHAVAIDEHRACFQANLFRPNLVKQHKSYKQRWFAGAHADVGGGYEESENGLAKITLEWMYAEAEAFGCQFVAGQKEYFLGRKGNGVSLGDVMAKAHNSTTGLWHLLEFLPRKQWDHDSEPEEMRWFAPNLYCRRKIPSDAVFHPSVEAKLRQDPSYRPPNLPPSPVFCD